MANEVRELRNDIAASLFMKPCTEKEFYERDLARNKSPFGIGKMLQWLDKEGATFYKGEVIHIKRSWAKENLKGYELDFRTPREKELAGMTDFAKQALGYE